jgi:hypothetical protein
VDVIHKTLIRKLFAGSLIALAGGLVLLAVAGGLAIANSSLVKNGPRRDRDPRDRARLGHDRPAPRLARPEPADLHPPDLRG